MRTSRIFPGLLAGLAVATVAAAQGGRDYVTIVGSSTVYPFTTTAAEQFGKASKFKTPKVESTGTGGGFKLFCSGVGTQYPDLANASRAIKPSEVESCAKAGVKDIIEIRIGYDGLSIATAKAGPTLALTRRDLYLALAKQVPDPKKPGALVPNPYRSWNEVNPKLPAARIEVLGPPPTSGTRDAFVELVMQPGCTTIDSMKALKTADPARFQQVCDAIREDGVYVEAGENDNLIAQKLQANPRAVGIFGYSFLEENAGQLKGASIEGVAPSFETIASGQYPVSRPLFVYAKQAHLNVIPGFSAFLAELVSQRSMGEEGYLAEKGLVPLPAKELAAVRARVTALSKTR
jgi:phosphate transport system substrate-binding protein